MKLYAIKEYNIDVFVTKHLNVALHEMLSMILTKIQHGDNYKNILIEEYINYDGKKYRYITDAYTFSPESQFLIKSTNDNSYNICKSIQHCEKLIKQIKSQITDIPKTHHYKTHNDQYVHKPANTNDLINKTRTTLNNLNTSPLIPKQNTEKINTEEKNIGDDNSSDNESMMSILNSDSESENENEDEILKIQKQIKELQELKTNSQKQIAESKKSLENQVSDLIDFSADVNYIKKKQFLEKDAEEKRRGKYYGDKKAFYMIRKDIKKEDINEENILSNPLFKDKFPVFEFMNQKGLISENDDMNYFETEKVTDDYFIYCKLIDENKPEAQYKYIPHDFHYLTDEEQKIYGQSVDKHKESINEYFDSQCKPKKLDDILKELDEESEVEYDDIPDLVSGDISKDSCEGSEKSEVENDDIPNNIIDNGDRMNNENHEDDYNALKDDDITGFDLTKMRKIVSKIIGVINDK